MGSNVNIPKIALSSRYSRNPCELLKFARKNDFNGIEYSILEETKKKFDDIKDNLIELSDSEFEIRYHLPFKKVELSHINESFARDSLNYMKYCIDNISEIGGKHIIIHLGLGYKNALDKICYENAKKYLGELVKYAKTKNIIVCLENLTFGLITSSDSFLNMINETGCRACIDIGHVAASPSVTKGEISMLEYIDLLLPHLEGTHIYDKEIDMGIHTYPKNKDLISDRIKKIYNNENCIWWLIELGEPKEILLTKSFLEEILDELIR